MATPGQGHVHVAYVLPLPSSDSSALWLGTHDGLFLKALAKDAPAGWRKVGAPLQATDVMAVSSARRAGSPVYAAGHSIGVQRSDDGGIHWRQIMPGSPARDVHALAVDPQEPKSIYIWAEVVGMLTSTNGGATWEITGEGKSLKNPVQATALAVSRPTQTAAPVLYAGTNLGLFISKDGGESWSSTQGEVADQPVYSLLALDGPEAQGVYAGTASGLLRSVDAGGSWERLEGASALGGVAGLAYDESAGPPGRLLAVNAASQVFISEDRGRTWTLLP